MDVSVAGEARPIHFVTDEVEHVAFFRDAIEVDDADESTFPALAQSAFPRLYWAEGVWRGLRDFSKPFRDVRGLVTVHLGVLNDHAASVFRSVSDPRERGKTLSALGAEASDERGSAKRHKPSENDRTRRFERRALVFWWHTKLQRHIDRIHFLWEPGANPESDRIIVGIFKHHCLLPD